MTPHRASYSAAYIARKPRAFPDIGPASLASSIARKKRAHPDIDSLPDCPIARKTRAHPDIGQTRGNNINHLARAAEDDPCKKCRVTRKYYVPAAHSFTATHTHGPGPLLHLKQRDCTHHRNCRHHHRCRAPQAYALWAGKETQTQKQRSPSCHRAPGGPASTPSTAPIEPHRYPLHSQKRITTWTLLHHRQTSLSCAA
jgi:hypothetical protein